MNINFFQGSSQHLSQLQSVSGGFLFSFLQKFCLVLHQIIVLFYFLCLQRASCVAFAQITWWLYWCSSKPLRKSTWGTQLYTKSSLSALFSPLLIDHRFILKTHSQPRTTLPHQQPRMQNDQKLTLPPRCALVWSGQLAFSAPHIAPPRGGCCLFCCNVRFLAINI